MDPDVVLVELDEVKVHAQAHTRRKPILALTAVVIIAGCCWHLAAATTPELAYQVGALLAVLGVPRGTRRLLVLADGARWIREWFEGLGLSDGTMIVCWWHLVKRCQQDLSRACRGRAHRREIESVVLKALWHGRVDEALEILRTLGGDEECGGVGGSDRLPGSAPSLPAGLRGTSTSGFVDRKQPGGEVQRLERLGAV